MLPRYSQYCWRIGLSRPNCLVNEAMIFSRSCGAKPPLRASSAKRSRMALREEMRGTKKTMVEAAQTTTMRKPRRFATSLRVSKGFLQFQREGVRPWAHTRLTIAALLRAGRLQVRHDQHAGVSPESAVGAH